MTPWTRHLAATLALTAVVLGGCRDAPAPSPANSSVSSPLTSGADVTLGERQVLLGIQGTRQLLGVVADAPPNADPALRMSVTGDQRLATDASVERARWLPNDVLLAIDGRGQLLEWVGARSRVLAQEVSGPVGASVDGRFVVYTVGEAPDLEVARYDRVAGTSSMVSDRMAPCWGPGVSPDGSEVVFVSATRGRPQWWRQGVGSSGRLEGAPRLLADGADLPFAASLSPTLVSDAHLVFGAHTAEGFSVEVLSRTGRRLHTIAGARMPVWQTPGSVVAYRSSSGRIAMLDLAEVTP